jgi:2-keto-4-pentenoate hydratase
MTTEATLIQQLVDAQRSGTHGVDAAPYAALDQAAAYRVQTAVLQTLGEAAGLYKSAVAPDGTGVIAPIFASRVGQSGAFQLSTANLLGLEVEVAVVLGKDIPAAGLDEIDLVEAIDHYIVGIEVVGSRFVDRSVAGFYGGLADGMASLGYVIDPTHRASGADLDNLDVELSLAGKQIYAAPAKHSFATVLASLIAYSKTQMPQYPLKAGTIVTTGSLCGLVPVSGPGRVVAQLGVHRVEFDLV